MLIPTFAVRDVRESVDFYTRVLDFALAAAPMGDPPFYAVLTRGDDELHLNLAGDGARRSAAILVVADVDATFARCLGRGYSVPDRPESPVHLGPLDQTWGTREVYLDDPSGNTLILQQR